MKTLGGKVAFLAAVFAASSVLRADGLPGACPSFVEGNLPKIAGCAGMAGTPIPQNLKPAFKSTAEAACRAIQPPSAWQAGPASLAGAPCRKTTPPTNAEMEKFITDYGKSLSKGGKKETRTIRGIRFVNENPALLDLFEQLVTYAYATSPSQNGPDLSAPGCTQVLCALKKLFGTTVGLQTAYIKAKYGFNTSHLAWPNSQKWGADDLNLVMRSLDDFAPGVFPILGGNMRLSLHDDHGDEPANTLANAKIEIMSGEWAGDKANPDKLERVMFHELSHQWGEAMTRGGPPGGGLTQISGTQSWQSITGWRAVVPAGKRQFAPYRILNTADICMGQEPGRACACSSAYGSCNPAEDFAESAVEYRFNPRELWARSPEKYLFLRDYMFDGLEYTSDGDCQASRSSAARFMATATASLAGSAPSDAALDLAQKECGSAMREEMSAARAASRPYPPAEGLSESTYRCLSSALTEAAFKSQIRIGTEWCKGLTEAGYGMKSPFPPNAPESAVTAAAAALINRPPR